MAGPDPRARSLKALGTFTQPEAPPPRRTAGSPGAAERQTPAPPPAPLAWLAPWLEGAVDVVRGGLWGSEGAADTAAAKGAELVAAGLPLVGGLTSLKALGFFSRVDKALDLIPAKGAHPNKVASLLKSNASAEELAYRGVPEFLASKGNATVTRAELAAHLAAHPAPVPVVKTRRKTPDTVTNWLERNNEGLPQTPDEWTQLSARLERTAQGWQRNGDPETANRFFGFAEDASRHAEGVSTTTGSTAGQPRHARWQVPGGKNYRETLLTRPEQPPPALPPGYSIQPVVGDRRGAKFTLEGPDGTGYVLPASTAEQAHAGALNYLQRQGVLPSPANFHHPHYPDDPNILVHTRANERTLPTGERGRFIEEVQSDWHQKGKQEGYALASGSPERRQLEAERAAASAAHTATADALSEAKNRWKYGTGNPEREALDRQLYGAKARPLSGSEALEAKTRQDVLRAEDLRRVEAAEQANNAAWQTYKALDDQLRAGVPDAPFKESWPDLGLKQQVLETAADPNAEWIGFTGGATQAARYDLSKQIQSIDYRRKPGPGSWYELGAVDKDGDAVRQVTGLYQEHELADVVGKELAEKIVKGEGQPGGGRMTLRGVDLQVGGEGMRYFYDQLLPKRLEKILKPFGGGPVERTNVAMQPAWLARLTPEMKARILKEGLPLLSLLPLGVLGNYGQPQAPEPTR